MEDAIQTIKHKGYTIKLQYDPSPESPREWADIDTIYSNCRRYNPDGHSIEELIEDVGGDVYDDVIPWDKIGKKYYYRKVWMYDHSGVALRTGENNPWGTGWMSWDSGLMGVIVIDKKVAKKEWSKDTKARAEKYLDGQIKTLDTYVSGQIFGYEIEDEEGNDCDSCWGFYSEEEAIEEAKSMVDYDYELRFGEPLFAEAEAEA